MDMRRSLAEEDHAMNELVFLVEEAPEGGYTARALTESILTEADDFVGLEANVRDAVRCHFAEVSDCKAIHLRTSVKSADNVLPGALRR
jgi:hypothetical protein